MGSAVLEGLALDAWLIRLDSGLMEAWISVAVVSVGLTLMAVTRMIRALNIIDGHKRLASTVAILVLCAYPVFETLFSFCRRIVVRTWHPCLPDVAYLQHLIYKRLLHWPVGSPLPRPRAQCNAASSPHFWLITSVGVLSAVLIWNRSVPLTISALCFAALYAFGHVRPARFGSPDWLIARRGRAPGLE